MDVFRLPEMSNSFRPWYLRRVSLSETNLDRKVSGVTIYPTALFWRTQINRNAELLLTLTNNKWPLGVDPGGHHFVVLNVSIKNKQIFFSEVVVNRKWSSVVRWLFGIYCDLSYYSGFGITQSSRQQHSYSSHSRRQMFPKQSLLPSAIWIALIMSPLLIPSNPVIPRDWPRSIISVIFTMALLSQGMSIFLTSFYQ